jgi:negative regulator of flagellin synthesis FlgM
MNVNNSLQGMQQLFSSREVAATSGKTARAETEPGKAGADQATLSAAASVAASSSPDSDVRMEKVAAVQAALASGTYNVPSSAVAGKMIDQMMGKSK